MTDVFAPFGNWPWSRRDPDSAANQQHLDDVSQQLWMSAIALTNSQQCAAKLILETTIRALTDTNAPREPRRYKSWLHDLMRSAKADGIRRGAEELARITASKAQANEPTTSKMLTRQAFEQLSAEHQAVLALVDVRGQSYEQAAADLGVSRDVVMSRVAQARGALVSATTNLRRQAVK